MSAKEAQRALRFLEELGVYCRIFKDVATDSRYILRNVMYIKLDIDRLIELTLIKNDDEITTNSVEDNEYKKTAIYCCKMS